ncbi:MAG: hypothetical protein EDR02_12700 [Actinobacteria bacterium]|nr:MAG: hypothetical protein EDR02_12700 [Actinomycetota bacterium]RIK03572.1 MAG: hypothetical protein DCC48_16140 [Acidobacteriota bacterium]
MLHADHRRTTVIVQQGPGAPRLRRLLDQLDRTYHTDRVRTVALLGRDNAGDPALPPLLDDLATQSDYHHQLALIAAAAVAMTGDSLPPSATIRRRSGRSPSPTSILSASPPRPCSTRCGTAAPRIAAASDGSSTGAG